MEEYGGSGRTMRVVIFSVKNGAGGLWFQWCIELCGNGWGRPVDVATR